MNQTPSVEKPPEEQVEDVGEAISQKLVTGRLCVSVAVGIISIIFCCRSITNFKNFN